MDPFQILITKQAKKDIDALSSKEKSKLKIILESVISENPYQGKKLLGPLIGNYSYRLTINNRIVYSINTEERIVYIKRARTHYGE